VTSVVWANIRTLATPSVRIATLASMQVQKGPKTAPAALLGSIMHGQTCMTPGMGAGTAPVAISK